MKLRTFTALLLAAIMLFALTACGSQAADDSSSDQQQEQQDTTTNESNEFRVGMECAYAPNNWQESEATDSNVPVENVAGTYAEGYDVQIAKAIADGLGKELVIVKLSWDGLIDALNQGQIDAIIAGMMDTAERRESINFSEPYRETTYGLMVLADSPYLNATSIQDFSGAAVLGQQGTALDDVIDQIEGVDKKSYPDFTDLLNALKSGAIDGYVAEEPTALEVCGKDDTLTYLPFVNNDTGFTATDAETGIAVAFQTGSSMVATVNDILATIPTETRQALMAQMVSLSADPDTQSSDAIVLQSSNTDTSNGVFRIAMECAYAPFNWTQTTDANGAVPISGKDNLYASGYDVQVAKYIAAELGMSLEVYSYEWDSLIAAVQSGAVDAIIAGMSPTAEREEQVDFTDCYYNSNLVVIIKK